MCSCTHSTAVCCTQSTVGALPLQHVVRSAFSPHILEIEASEETTAAGAGNCRARACLQMTLFQAVDDFSNEVCSTYCCAQVTAFQPKVHKFPHKPYLQGATSGPSRPPQSNACGPPLLHKREKASSTSQCTLFALGHSAVPPAWNACRQQRGTLVLFSICCSSRVSLLHRPKVAEEQAQSEETALTKTQCSTHCSARQGRGHRAATRPSLWKKQAAQQDGLRDTTTSVTQDAEHTVDRAGSQP